MAIPLAEQILGVVKEGLSLWKVFISTRQEAYNRQQDKKQVAAIESAEKYILTNESIIARIDQKEFKKELGTLAHFKARFFKYN